MEFTTLAADEAIDFGATGIRELSQNIRTIVTTAQGSVALNRAFGIDISPLDSPMNALNQARLTERIVAAIQQNEPRVEVVRVDYKEDGPSGRLLPSITFRLREGVRLE
ncbi:hypothetical protein DUZ99_04585 [Xylanibacillus composti]|uniref:IraD/Gp25-like domain-containing protein n=1 Tax=Xylanibacillus composti TaxID=1572762 RepID=A0A8J4M2M3_9BACL|nr:GPW/gp25 family protein [Xylanibacillus composti]MDT9724265.1 hypothetical protein [Xylanibacillus composti]GIQ69260.1 hypothetical protein XYCOK13_20840 [Xylanibacillus composti]